MECSQLESEFVKKKKKLKDDLKIEQRKHIRLNKNLN